MAMEFDRGWDFDHGNTPITLNKIKQDDETIAAIQALVGDGGDGGGGTFEGDLGDLSDDTVDTAAEYRLIMFSNGNVKAIPVNTPDPLPPTNLDADIQIASVTLTWDASVTPGSKTYVVYRDGVQIGTTTSLSYRDATVVATHTYLYKVRITDQYTVPSGFTSEISAFIDPALNVAPTVEVLSWPAAFVTDGKTLIRVNASDPDGQVLTLAAVVQSGTGSLVATDDPSIYYYTPA